MLNPRTVEAIRRGFEGLGLQKEAFTPMTPEAQQSAQDPTQGAGGPPPGMDPSQMPPPGAGAPPPGAGAPPPGADPSQGLPAQPPGPDPSQGAGAPPADPAQGAGAPPQTVQVSLPDLMQLFQQVQQSQAAAQGGQTPVKHEPDKALHDKVDALQQQVGTLMNALGATAKPAEIGAGQPSNAPADVEQIQAALPMPKQASDSNAKRRKLLDGLARQSSHRR